MSKRPSGSTNTGVQLFPFLAVLLCTMGALILLLMLIAQQARTQVEREQARAAAVAAAKPKVDTAELQRRRDDLEWKAKQLAAAREKTLADLAEHRAQLSHLEEHSQRLRQQLAELDAAKALLGSQATTTTVDRSQLEAELAALAAKIAETKEKLEKLKAAGQKPQAFAVVPYDGKHGTRRRPIYIECRGDSIVLQPEGIVFRESDFLGTLGPGNPLAAAVRTVSEYLVRGGMYENGEQPYPLMLVRPTGIGAYYAARAAMSNWDGDFGYELVNEDWPLEFPQADPLLNQMLVKTVEEARIRQAMIAKAAPRLRERDKLTHKPSPFQTGGGSREGRPGGNGGGNQGGPGGGQGAPSGSGMAGDRYAQGGGNGMGAGNGTGAGAGGGGAAGYPGDDNRYAQAGGGGSVLGTGNVPSGSGTGFGDATGGGGGNMPGGSNGAPGGGDFLGGNSQAGGGGSQGGGNSQGGGGSTGGGAGGGGPSLGAPSGDDGRYASGGNGTGTGSGNSATGNPPNGDASSQPGSYTDRNDVGSGGGPGGASSVANAGSNGTSSGAYGTPGGGGGSTGGSAVSPYAPSGGSSGGSSGSSGGGSSGGSPTADMSGTPPSVSATVPAGPGEYVESMARTRGRNWGLPETARSSTPLTRPIQMYCSADSLTLFSDRGAPDKQIAFTGRTQDSIDTLVSQIWDHVKVWGIAGRGMYWKPILSVHVSPDGMSRFNELKQLLENSGLEVTGKQITLAAPAAAAPSRR